MNLVFQVNIKPNDIKTYYERKNLNIFKRRYNFSI